ncbi:MAG: RCC1 domain-containing protein, partial [Acidimicrobiales bacterium]
RGNTSSAARVSGGLKLVSVTAGGSYACGLASSGIAYCWGILPGSDSEPGGEPSARRVPVPVAGDLTFTSVSAGFWHACGVTTTGAVYCWGENDNGQLGNGSTTRSTKPVRVASELTFRSVSAGGLHSCAVATTGPTYCWGSGAHGALGNGSEQSSTRPVAVRGGTGFATVSAGYLYACALTTDGAAYCWGYNEFGQLGDGTERSTAVPRAVAGGHVFRSLSAGRTAARATTCGVTRAGAALCWGWTSEALGRRDIENDSSPGPVVGDLVFRTVSVGGSHACGVLADGDVYCWGANDDGQLGDGSTITRRTPAVVPIPR